MCIQPSFFIKHIRIIRDDVKVETIVGELVEHAKIVRQARAEELNQDFPNTVMYLYDEQLAQICSYIDNNKEQILKDEEGYTQVSLEIPLVVTVDKEERTLVARDAAGFFCRIDQEGKIYHLGNAAGQRFFTDS